MVCMHIDTVRCPSCDPRWWEWHYPVGVPSHIHCYCGEGTFNGKEHLTCCGCSARLLKAPAPYTSSGTWTGTTTFSTNASGCANSSIPFKFTTTYS